MLDAINDNQSNQQPDPSPPPSRTKRAGTEPECFVVLPAHPLYGRCVTVLRRKATTTYVDCLIEDPAQPGFRYRIHEWWLSSAAPPPLPPPSPQTTGICVPLATLDKMVQFLLTLSDSERSSLHAPPQPASPVSRSAPADLEPVATDLPDATRGAPVLHRARPRRRHTP